MVRTKRKPRQGRQGRGKRAVVKTLPVKVIDRKKDIIEVEVEEDTGQELDIDIMSKEELMALCDDLGITYKKRWTKPVLKELIRGD